MMKKILLLGGSAQQIIAIDAAKKLGYYTVLCDYLTDNPGQYHADRFYLVSTIDKEAVLKVAEDEKIDGVLAYASDPAAPTAAFVAEKLGLPTNPFDSVTMLCDKQRFRAFLHENGFHTPVSRGYREPSDALADTALFQLPVIVKPTDASGSKGVTVLHDWDGFAEAIAFAAEFSRSKSILVEEYIEKGYPYVIGGDVFAADGEVKIWGLMDCHRDPNVNPLVPVGKSYPAGLPEETLGEIRSVISSILRKLDIRSGAVNVELIVDKQGRVFPIDFGPRCGGNMIPVLMNRMFGVDIAALSVQAAMGEQLTIRTEQPEGCYATCNLHSDREGVFGGLQISDQIKPYITDTFFYAKEGDEVHYFDNASKALGIVFMHFPDKETMDAFLEEINAHIQVIVR